MASATRWHRVMLAFILASYAALAVAYNVLQPIGEAPDEPAHVEFVQYIQQNHALPVNPVDAPAHLDPLAPGIEYDQVPLYYAVLAALLSPIWLPPGARLHRDPFIGWPGHPWQRANDLHWLDEGWPYHGLALFVHAGRLLSVLFGLVTLVATYALVRRIVGSAPALFATAWLGWGPGFLLTGSHLNNDGAATAASAVVLYLSAYLLTASRPSKLAFAVVGLALGAALLSKVHTLFVVPLVIVAIASSVPESRAWPRTLGRRAAAVGAVLLPALTSLAVWWLIIGHTYSRRLNVAVGVGVAGVGARVSDIDWNRLPAALLWFNSTWWGGIGAGVETLWWPAFYLLLAGPVLILMWAGIRTLLQGDGSHTSREPAPKIARPTAPLRALMSRWNSWPPQRRAASLLVIDAIPLFYATITRQVFPWVDLDANSRFVLPAAPTIAMLVTIGGVALPLARARRSLAIGYTGGLLVLSLATAVYLLPQISAPTIPARLARSPAEASAPALATFASGVELMSVDNIPPSLAAGNPLHVTLRWRVKTTPRDGFIVFTHLVGREEEGRVSSGHDEIPFERDFPPTLWQPGEIIEQRQDLTPLRDLGPGLYSLQVGMYQLQADKITPIAITSSAAPTDHVVVATWKVLPTVDPRKTAHAVDARFGDDLMLLGQSVKAEPDGMHVTLTWKALRAPTRRLVVSAQVLDASGKLIAQHDGEPVDGRLPTTSWESGDVVQDTHVVAGAPIRSDLAVVVAVYDRETHLRLPVTESGRASADYITLAR